MSKEPAEDKAIPTNGSEEPQGADDHEGGDHPRIKKKRLGVDPSLIISDGRSKRRKTPTLTPETDVKKEDATGERDPKDPERAATLGRDIYQKVLDLKDKDGEEMAPPFMKLPNKRSFPDYYDTIKHPMCLEMVDKKLQTKGYETLKEVVADLGQIFNNAKRYNTKESLLFQWAKRMHKIVRTFYANITNPGEAEPDSEHEDGPGAGGSSAPPDPPMDVDVEQVGVGRGISESIEGESAAAAAQRKKGGYMREGPTVYKLIKPVLKSIKDAKSLDGQGREIAGIFMELPDRKDLPDYYKVITNPVSLQEIEDRMVGRKYETVDEFFGELETMCNNAFTYNEDDSDVFKDAKQIKNILDYHRNEIRSRLAQPSITKFKVSKTNGGTPVHGRPSTSAEPPVKPFQPSPAPTAIQHRPNYPIPQQQPQQPPQQQQATRPAHYLPALPKGVVTEEVVASLDRYPLYEQQAWAQTLPPVSMQIYRQIQAGNEARRRIAEGQGVGAVQTGGSHHQQPLPQLAELPSSGRPVGPGGSRPTRPAPPLPTIRCIDFAFNSESTTTAAATTTSSSSSANRQAIRLHNMRGVVSHAVVVSAQTSEIELTAYIADPPTKSINTIKNTDTNGSGAGVGVGELSPAHFEDIPEVSLRINGNQGNIPRFIFAGNQKDKPAGMRWVVQVPAVRADTKIEIRATKPGALAETSSIYINRQM